jgi:hypothetical protein
LRSSAFTRDAAYTENPECLHEARFAANSSVSRSDRSSAESTSHRNTSSITPAGGHTTA